MKKKGRKSRVNNSQRMLQALDEQDLTKADQYFRKALETDSSEVLYLKQKKFTNISLQNSQKWIWI